MVNYSKYVSSKPITVLSIFFLVFLMELGIMATTL